MKKTKISQNYSTLSQKNNFEKKYSFKKVKFTDYLIIFNWINDETTRKYSINQKKISLETHRKWLRKKIDSKNDYFKFFCFFNEKIGLIRYDDCGDYFKLNYLIDKNRRGKNYSYIMINMSLEDNLKNFTKPIFAEVIENNQASKRILLKCGFKKIVNGKDNNLVKFVYQSK